MHGELIEFNERLHRALLAKEALVSQMRQELIDLRGPVSAPPGKASALLLCPLSICPPTSPAAHIPTVEFVHCWQCRGYRKVDTERVSIRVPAV